MRTKHSNLFKKVEEQLKEATKGIYTVTPILAYEPAGTSAYYSFALSDSWDVIAVIKVSANTVTNGFSIYGYKTIEAHLADLESLRKVINAFNSANR